METQAKGADKYLARLKHPERLPISSALILPKEIQEDGGEDFST